MVVTAWLGVLWASAALALCLGFASGASPGRCDEVSFYQTSHRREEADGPVLTEREGRGHLWSRTGEAVNPAAIFKATRENESMDLQQPPRKQPGQLAAAIANHAVQVVLGTFFNALLAELPAVSAAILATGDPPEAACSAHDKLMMGSRLSIMHSAIDTAELPESFNLLPEHCQSQMIFIGGLNYTATAECFRHLMNVSRQCGDCHIKSLEAFTGSGVYDLGCIPVCMKSEEHCEEDLQSQVCYQQAAGCMECAKPAFGAALACHGALGSAQVLKQYESCIGRMKGGVSLSKTPARHMIDYLTECFFGRT